MKKKMPSQASSVKWKDIDQKNEWITPWAKLADYGFYMMVVQLTKAYR